MVWFTHPLLERFPKARTATDFGDSLGHLFDFLGERSAPVQGPRVDVWSSERLMRRLIYLYNRG